MRGIYQPVARTVECSGNAARRAGDAPSAGKLLDCAADRLRSALGFARRPKKLHSGKRAPISRDAYSRVRAADIENRKHRFLKAALKFFNERHLFRFHAVTLRKIIRGPVRKDG